MIEYGSYFFFFTFTYIYIYLYTYNNILKKYTGVHDSLFMDFGYQDFEIMFCRVQVFFYVKYIMDTTMTLVTIFRNGDDPRHVIA